MASQSCRDSEPLVFVEKKPHFFKIILEDSNRNGKLTIPRKFLQTYGNDLPNHMLIEVPNGIVWQVELRKCDGDVWLQKGWQEFAEYYSLAHGNLVVFEYKGNCDFLVLIFDKSATEIEYPLTRTHGKKERDHDRECQKTRDKFPLPCPRPHKMMRTNLSNKTESTLKLPTLVPPQSTGMKPEKSKRNLKSYCSASKDEWKGSFSRNNGARCMSMAMMGQRSSRTGFVGSMQTFTSYEKAKALERAIGFKSKNPFFKVAIQPSHVHNENRMAVPGSFARKYFGKKFDDVVLCTSDGRTWSAKYYHTTVRGYPSARIHHGWRAFAQDNYLEVGDVCVFELINVTEMLFKVVIFCQTDNARCQLSPESADGRRANEVEPNRNNAIRNSNFDCTCDIDEDMSGPCAKFSNKQFQAPKIDKIDDDSSVELLDGSSQCKFGQVVLRKNAGEQITQGPSCSVASEALEIGSKFISEKPFFKVALQLHHLEPTKLNVPISFVKRYIRNRKNLTLQVADRSWPVKLNSYSSNSTASLSAGWLEFARDNSLQVGDVCMFELIRTGVLKVSIFQKC